MDTLLGKLPAWGAAVDALAAAMSAIAAGTAVGIPYTFSTTTTDSDPGAGYLRLDNATQNTATTIRADLVGADGSTWTDVLATFAGSDSTVKGHILLQKLADATKWILFTVSAVASPSGYKNITVAVVSASSANPFTNNDSIILKFSRTGDKGANGTAAVMTRTTRTSNTVLEAGNMGTLIDVTGASTFTQTFTAAATLGSGWFVFYRNSGTGDVTLDPDGEETIDGVISFIMYPGECRLIQCDGSGFYTIVIQSFLKKFTTTASFYVPPRYKTCGVICIGAGGGGGGGRRNDAAEKKGGAGGGGGCYTRRDHVGSLTVGTAITCTVGAGGTPGAGSTTNNGATTSGGVGGTSAFGTFVVAYGGGGGYGQTAGSTGGAGGGYLGAGGNSNGGAPFLASHFGSTSTIPENIFGGGSAAMQYNATQGWATTGGAAGAASCSDAAQAQQAGGSSQWGGGGGGAGASMGNDSGRIEATAGGKGGVNTISTGGGGAGGTGTSGEAGTAGSDSVLYTGSDGGGGGGYKGSLTSGAGGNGGAPGGGAGGGGCNASGTGGAGGTGGRGEVIVWGIV